MSNFTTFFYFHKRSKKVAQLFISTCKQNTFQVKSLVSEGKGKTENKTNNLALAEIKTNIQKRGQHCFTAPSTFRLVPKRKYKPVLQYPCKLNPADVAMFSAVSQKYSIVRKGPSIN